MSESVTEPAVATAREESLSLKELIAPALFFVAVWFGVINHLQSEWSYNPQYSYGWSVPFLAVYQLWRRWPERPQLVRPSYSWPALVVIILGALLLLPLRFVSVANPDWRMLSWLFALDAEVVSLGAIYLAGGLRALRYWAFPFLFFLVAVPWPALFEQLVTQTLMRMVTAINVFFLNLVGTPALQHGNVIEVAAGMIGIEEACSGVRSLQATLMISLFLGELYSFSMPRRTVLVMAGVIFAFVCNVARTAFLVQVSVRQGSEAIHKWHDPAGLTILLICLFGLWGISLFMRRGASASAMALEQPTRPAGLFYFPVAVAAAVVVWVCAVEAFVQSWYTAQSSNLAAIHWDVRWPANESGYQSVSVPPEAQGLLGYSSGGGGMWQGTDNRKWLLYFFQWLPGRTAARFVKVHRPDICLPASGLTMVADHGIRLLEVSGVKLPIHSYRFEQGGTPLHVFYCYWDGRSSYDDAKTAGEEDWTPQGRIRAAWRGKREVGAQMMELVVWGVEDDASAEAALQRRLAEVVQRQG